MKKYKLICLDIDGTLLDDNKKLLPEVIQAIQEEAEKGIFIALATGRMPAGVDFIEKELGVQCIKICCAGTYVILGSECISAEYLLPNTMKDIYLEFAEKNQVPLWIFREKEWYVTDIDSYVAREIQIIQHQPKVAAMETLKEQWEKEKTGPNKLLIAASPEKIQTIYQEMKEQAHPGIDIARSADTFIEIFPKGVTKGTALLHVCEKLKISPKDTIAFGDQELDLPMIEAAGIGIAMGNAIPEVKEKADFITKTNNEAGIAYALKNYIRDDRKGE